MTLDRLRHIHIHKHNDIDTGKCPNTDKYTGTYTQTKTMTHTRQIHLIKHRQREG